jgi:protoporphyrinogen oxidase
MILIIGAGLAGLSTAFHLDSLPYKIFEKEKEVGGLCRSYHLDGFTFDFTGHLLHFRQTEIRTLIERLLAGRLAQHIRRSSIYSHGRYTEYPFQVNTFGLPPEVIRECLLGFIATLTRLPSPPVASEDRSFREWILENLGEGMAKHFMIPFNEKLWQVPLDELTSDWVSWLVPKPELKDVINGALGIKDKAFGYNPTFLYPVRGGIEALPRALSAALSQIECGCQLIEIDTAKRQALFQDGRIEQYERLVSTIPIPELVRRCTDFPPALKDAAADLRCVSVYNINLGVSREHISDKHWIYFPEPDYPFYRAGFPMNFSPSLGRPGCSSVYVEVPHQPNQTVPRATLLRQVRDGMERAGILSRHDEIVVADVRDIRYAYVLFDKHRARVLPGLLSELERRGIYSIGRYGRWEHTSMEDAISQGKKLAERFQAAQPTGTL